MLKHIHLAMAVSLWVGAAQAVELSQIRPFNVGSKVFSYRVSEVTDARFNPPRVIRRFIPTVIDNGEAAASYLKGHMTIKNLKLNAPWEGENADVQIKSALNRNCLTVTGHPLNGPNSVQLEWLPCQKDTAGLAFLRQVFFLRTNASRASALESSIQEDLGLPNPQLKCVERLNATQVGLRDCAGIGNWTVTH